MYGKICERIHKTNLLRIKRHAQQDECISKPLNTYPDRPMPHIRAFSCFNRIEVHIDNLVQVVCDNSSYLQF